MVGQLKRDDVTQCDICWASRKKKPFLISKCREVADDHGLTLADVLGAYLRDYHRKGHK